MLLNVISMYIFKCNTVQWMVHNEREEEYIYSIDAIPCSISFTLEYLCKECEFPIQQNFIKNRAILSLLYTLVRRSDSFHDVE